MTEPISVLEMLPSGDYLCVLYINGGTYKQLRWRALGYYSGGDWYVVDECISDTDIVTHWLPVPDFP